MNDYSDPHTKVRKPFRRCRVATVGFEDGGRPAKRGGVVCVLDQRKSSAHSFTGVVDLLVDTYPLSGPLH